MRLIDADALLLDNKQYFCGPCKEEGHDYHEVACRACWVDDMRIAVEDAPTVDAVEVVRCKECKHYNKDALWCNINSAQFAESHYNWYAEDFCSYGAKMDGDGNDI